MQSRTQAKPSVGVVFDSDMGNRIDTALALSLLYGLEGKQECRVVAVSTTKPNLKSAALLEVLRDFFVVTENPQFRGFLRTLPVGYAEQGANGDETPILKAVLAPREYTIKKLNDTAEPHALIRNSFTAQHDGNAIMLLAGPATNLTRALQLPGVKGLAAQKVRLLVVSQPELHEKADPAAMKTLLAEWPGPMVIVPSTVGEVLRYPAASIEKDFSWSASHPIVDAYRAYRPMPYDAPAADMAAVLYAVRPNEGYFKVVDNKLQVDPAQIDRIVRVFTEIASAKPVPRQFRRPMPMDQQQQQQKPAEPPKAGEAKPAP